MDLAKIISELRREREDTERAIRYLERLDRHSTETAEAGTRETRRIMKRDAKWLFNSCKTGTEQETRAV